MPKAATMKGRGSVSSALTRALRFEKQGKRFFGAAAAKSSDGFARQVFELLAVLEDKHVQDILAISRKLGEDGKFPAVSSRPAGECGCSSGGEQDPEETISGDAAAACDPRLGGGARDVQADSRGRRIPRKRFYPPLEEEAKHFEVVYRYLDFLGTGQDGGKGQLKALSLYPFFRNQ
jgi:hypothetical protein